MRFSRTWILAAALLISACGTTGGLPPTTPRQGENPPAPRPSAATAPPVQAPAGEIPEKSDRAAGQTGEHEIQKQAGEGTPRPAPPRVTDREHNVYFPAGGTRVDESGKRLLRRHATRLKANSKLVLTLIGHTDPQGSRSYNVAIAQKRMDSVFEILRSLGVPRGQIRRVSSAVRMASTDCQTAACRRQMRRVELIFSE